MGVLILSIVGLWGTELLVLAEARTRDAYQRMELSSHVSTLRNAIEREINTTLQLSNGLIIYVAANPDLSNDEFSKVAANLIEEVPYILNVSLAKDNVITHVYPLAGNEKALGLNFMNVPEQRDAVLEAVANKAAVIAGPVDLVQGGRGLIGRIPVFLRGPEESLWGIASVVMDYHAFEGYILKQSRELGIQIAMQGRDGRGRAGGVFLGSSDLFAPDSGALIQAIALPVGEWLLAADHRQPEQKHTRSILIRSVGYTVTLLISLLCFLLLRGYSDQRYLSLHDTLTGLANRRLFDVKLHDSLARARRNKSLVGLIYIDLNDFKHINDTYGHREGDHVLAVISKRIKAALRESDFVARMGGDEFVVVLEDLEAIENTQRTLSILEQVLATPLTLGNSEKIQMAASMGVSVYPRDGEDRESLLKYADERMYAIKKGAR
jgi:diguanylate cyclase (GGDEF)-like protein